MKFVKLSIFALSLGLFAVSCDETADNETTDNDTATVIMEPAPMEPAPMEPDTTIVVTPTDTTTVVQ